MNNEFLANTPKADAMGFLAPQGRPAIAIENLPEYVDLLHVTAAPPFFTTTEQILDGAPTPDGQRILPGVRQFRALIDSQPQLETAASYSDIMLAQQAGRTAIVLGLQQAPQDANRNSLEQIFDAGIRVMALEYKEGNQRYGSGWLDSEGPLTDDGKTLLEDMADLGFILDLSHSGERTAQDALSFIDSEQLPLPLMASHGGIYESYNGKLDHINNKRNLSRATLERISDLGGLVGIYALTFGLSDHDNSDRPFLDQLHEANEIFLGRAVIGSDATYATRNQAEWEETFGFMLRNVAAGSEMEPRYPDTPFELNSEDRLRMVGEKLLNDGMSEEHVANLIGRTLINFFESFLPTTSNS